MDKRHGIYSKQSCNALVIMAVSFLELEGQQVDIKAGNVEALHAVSISLAFDINIKTGSVL